MKFKKTISLLLVFALLSAFACCFSAAGSEIVIGKAYISFSDNGIRTETGVNFPDPVGTIYGQSEVTLHAGDTVEDVTRAFVETIKLAQVEIGVKDGKNYLKALKNVITESGSEIASFGEGDGGTGSGWMVKLNGRVCRDSIDKIYVDTSNEIEWCFSCQNGADIGSDLANPSAAIIGLSITPGELSPAFSTGVKDYTVSYAANVSSVKVIATAENSAAEISYTLHSDGKVIEYKPNIDIPIKHFDLIVVSSKCYDELNGQMLTDTINIRILQDSPKPTNFIRAFFLAIIEYIKNIFAKLAG